MRDLKTIIESTDLPVDGGMTVREIRELTDLAADGVERAICCAYALGVHDAAIRQPFPVEASAKDVLMKFYDEVENATAELELLPNLIQAVIENLNLDRTKLSDDEIIEIGLHRGQLCSILNMTIYRIQETLEQMYKGFEIARNSLLGK